MPEQDHTEFLFMAVPFAALIACALLIGALA